jgi:hypothetical protein
MALTDNPNPKMKLPENWAEKMVCPVCGSRPLGVFHPTGHADRFVCGSCETSFELEDAGKRLRFITLPKGVTPWMRGQWVILEEALAAFEVFKNEQGSIQIENTAVEPSNAIPAPTVEPHVPTPEEIKMRPPVKPENKEQVEFEARVREEQVGYTNDNLLFDTDKGEIPDSIPLPFYEEDFKNTGPFKVSELFPEEVKEEVKEEKPVETPVEPVIPPEQEKDVWKNSEEERVHQALVHPPEGDFAGHFVKPESAIVPDVHENALSEAIEDKVKPQTPATVSVPTLPVQPKWSPEYSAATRTPVELPPLESLPPAKVEPETKPESVKPAATPVPPTLEIKQEDLGTIRSHISGAMLNPTMDDRMQDAMERAVELQRLGNTDQEVRSILERSSGLTPEQVAQVLKNLEKPEERKRSSRILLIFLVIALFVFAILTWWFFNNQSFTTPAGQTPAAGETQSSGLLPGKIIDVSLLPEQMRTFVPNGLTLFNDQPSVEPATEAQIPAADCPTSKAAAASLFGGPAKDWSQDTAKNGWMLMSTAQGIRVKIPANMTGGYLVFERGPEMRGISGPVYVKNIYMISISCK